ncbi:hypothetical protein [Hahella ganghwensis]|uniref:hypothetical protein n=1 Tax=Hahella ganghwensis TaxID=286420 RepID=UPI00036AB2D5|nr:hypothetical protein [Hahella ganghwensis]
MKNNNLPDHHQLIPLENPLPKWELKQKATGKALMITKEADAFMRNLNMYDKTRVYKAAEQLTSDGGYGLNSAGFKKSPMFMRYQSCSSGLGFMYSVNPEMIVVNQIKLDRHITSLHTPPNKQQMGLFEVSRTSNIRWHESISSDDIAKLTRAWGEPKAVPKISTEHVAINGMLNDLEKASWLMGVHMDTAYWDDYAKIYTLVYNPTRGGIPDFFECILDKIGTSKLAEFLAVMMVESQQTGKKRKWTAHSQGGIILTRAVELVNKRNIRLDGQRVSIHAGGNKKKRAEKAFLKAGMTIDNIKRDHPCDIVPNIAGMNDLSWSSIKRSASHASLVAGSKRPVEASPHTLPYLSAEYSIRLLQMCGYHDKAEKLAGFVTKEIGKS